MSIMLSIKQSIANAIIFEDKDAVNKILAEKFPGYSVYAIRDNGTTTIHYNNRFSFIISSIGVGFDEKS